VNRSERGRKRGKRNTDLARFFDDAFAAGIIDEAQLAWEEKVMEALPAGVGKVGGDGVVGWVLHRGG
jgi:hypothetical protein